MTTTNDAGRHAATTATSTTNEDRDQSNAQGEYAGAPGSAQGQAAPAAGDQAEQRGSTPMHVDRRHASTPGNDAELLRLEAACIAAEKAMEAAPTDAERDRICVEVWEPAYAQVCRLPAHTWLGFAVKVRTLLSEHENGNSLFATTLRRTTEEALARLLETSTT